MVMIHGISPQPPEGEWKGKVQMKINKRFVINDRKSKVPFRGLGGKYEI